MNYSRDIFNGYDIADIDEAARELLHTLAELDPPVQLSLAALARCMVVLGTDSDLDMASRLLDDLREVPFDAGNMEDTLGSETETDEYES